LRKHYRIFEKGKGIRGEFIKIHEKLGRRQKAINKSAPKVLRSFKDYLLDFLPKKTRGLFEKSEQFVVRQLKTT